jgi:squalene-hopene/tetraprenyl-beta-curcumene cyclase
LRRSGVDALPLGWAGRGLARPIDGAERGRRHDPTPIGFYFAKLWYFERLYPLAFAVAALGRAANQ